MSNRENGENSLIANSWPPIKLTVVIGAGGMSTAIARRLGETDRLLICDINKARVEVQADKLREDGLQVESAVCDVTDAASVAELAERIKGIGGFRRLAHVAGLSPSLADWRTILAVNLRGPALVTEALSPLVAPGSSAVLIASLSAYMAAPEEQLTSLLDDPLRPDLPEAVEKVMDQEMTPQLAYMLSKFAVIRLAQRLAIRWGQKGGRVVSLSPGLIASPQGLGEFKHSSSKYTLLSLCPLQRQGNMQEIADAVDFLTSDRASYINGIDLLVDGGLNAARLQVKSL